MQQSGASDQQTPSCKLIGINPDTEPPSHFMSGKTCTCNDGLNEGAKACILPFYTKGHEQCDGCVRAKVMLELLGGKEVE